MANYTITIQELSQRGYNFRLSEYPIFDETYRTILNAKIINHYFFREIGQETPDRFNFMLARKLDEIMPYYNKMYLSELLEFDPLATEYITNSRERENDTGIQTRGETKETANKTTGDIFSETQDKVQDRTADILGDTTDNTTVNTTTKDDTTSHSKTDTTNASNATADTSTTNDLKTMNNTSAEGSGSTDTTGTKSTVNSDMPQAGISITQHSNSDGTVDITTKGYATTQSVESTSQHSNTSTSESSDSTTANTGTIEVTATTHNEEDGTSETTGTQGKTGTVETTSANTGNETTKETEGVKENLKGFAQRNIDENQKLKMAKKETSDRAEREKEQIFSKGRRGFSASDLLQLYRKSFINIDVMVIDELENLFMGVF